ncbi:hypothetical protein [Phenylobacterium sp.]|uniref:hypothetical protein n=1 Tax=Phenylobacterium sp. TaxID=1871053 RepID=UPI0025F2EDA1|nr:hypothetical protein [Phenylobacterium sp.]
MIVNEAVARDFQQLALARVREAATDHSLAGSPSLGPLLFQWSNWTSVKEVRMWTDQELSSDLFVIAMAQTTASVAWSQGMGFGGMGDRVARPSTRIHLKPYADMVDTSRLEARVLEVSKRTDLTEQQQQIVSTFLSSPRGGHDGWGDEDEGEGQERAEIERESDEV